MDTWGMYHKTFYGLNYYGAESVSDLPVMFCARYKHPCFVEVDVSQTYMY
jgi:hypothetical protein